MRRWRLWLLGDAIAASPSPAMHNAALRACGLEGDYSLREVDGPGLRAVLEEMRAGAADGANVTIPHKRAAAAACSIVEGDAAILGAVNTLTLADGVLVGANTDAAGLEAALRTQGLVALSGRIAVVLGAGGAAAAAVLAAARLGASRVAVAARRAEAAAELAHRLERVVDVEPLGWDDGRLAGRAGAAGLLVNATPAGVRDLPFPVCDVAADCLVADLRYRPRPVDTVAAARTCGLTAHDGLEMLLQQGMLSFRRWTGLEPPWAAARAALEEAVAG